VQQSLRLPPGSFAARVFLFGSLAVTSNSSYRMNCQLGRQAKPSSDILVNQRLNSLLIHQTWSHNPVRVFTSIGKRLQQLVNQSDLFRRNLEFAGYSQSLSHVSILSQSVSKINERHSSCPQFLPHHEYMEGESLRKIVEVEVIRLKLSVGVWLSSYVFMPKKVSGWEFEFGSSG
jgi:hypothetical protein